MSGPGLHAVPKVRRWINPINFEQYDPNEPVPCLVGDPDGEVLLAAGMTAIVAEIGVGKTITQAGLAVSLAFGRDFLGFKIARQYKVLCVMADGDSPRVVRKRIARFAAGLGISKDELHRSPNLKVIAPEGFNLDNPACLAELMEELTDFDPDVVILETLISLAGAKRNMLEMGPAAEFMAACLRPLQRRQGGTRRDVIVGAHLTKAPNGRSTRAVKNRIAGSFYVAGGFDAVVMLDAGRQPRAFKLIEAKPSREGCTFRPRTIDIIGERAEALRLVVREQAPEDSKESEPGRPGPAPTQFNRARAVLAANPGISKTEFARLCLRQEPPIRKSTAYEAWI